MEKEIVSTGNTFELAELKMKEFNDYEKIRPGGLIYTFFCEGNKKKKKKDDWNWNIYKQRSSSEPMVYESYNERSKAYHRAGELNLKQNPFIRPVCMYDVEEREGLFVIIESIWFGDSV